MKPAGQPKQPGCSKWPISSAHVQVHSFLCNVNDTRALIGPFLLVPSHWEQIRDSWDGQVFTIAHTVFGLSLHIHSFIYLRPISSLWIILEIVVFDTFDNNFEIADDFEK